MGVNGNSVLDAAPYRPNPAFRIADEPVAEIVQHSGADGLDHADEFVTYFAVVVLRGGSPTFGE